MIVGWSSWQSFFQKASPSCRITGYICERVLLLSFPVSVSFWDILKRWTGSTHKPWLILLGISCHVFPDVAGRVAITLISMVDFLRVCVYIYKISFIATIHDPLVLLKPTLPKHSSRLTLRSTVLPHPQSCLLPETLAHWCHQIQTSLDVMAVMALFQASRTLHRCMWELREPPKTANWSRRNFSKTKRTPDFHAVALFNV